MSGDLWVMARNGTTLLPGEAKKLASAYDKLHEEVLYLRMLVGVEREVIEQLHQRVVDAEIACSIQTFTAAEHIKALEAMGAWVEGDIIMLPREMPR